MLLEAEPCLEGDVADCEADPPACHQLAQVFVLQYFKGKAGSMGHQYVFRQTGLFTDLALRPIQSESRDVRPSV